MRLPSLAVANLVLGGIMIAVGLPSVVADFRRLPVEATVGAIVRNEPLDATAIDNALPVLEAVATTSAAARDDLAMALLAGARLRPSPGRTARAAGEFRAYLADVPGDSRAWADLAAAEVMQGARQPAVQALTTSILTAPWQPGLVMARCALGIDLYADLDDEARGLVEEEFRIAAERTPQRLAQLVRERNAVLIARIMLIQSPEAMAKFESALARLPG
jgi:hypothetical protein